MDRKSNLGDTQFRYTPDAGTVEGPCYCGVCDAEMDSKRDCHGSRTFMEAMGGFKSGYDSFTCQFSDLDWHKQIVALREAAKKTPSARLECIYLEEAKEILNTRKPTKDFQGRF